MPVTCSDCGERYDAEERGLLCPHNIVRDICVHPYNKVYEDDTDGRVICMACDEVLIDPPPNLWEIAALEPEEQVRRQSRQDDIT